MLVFIIWGIHFFVGEAWSMLSEPWHSGRIWWEAPAQQAACTSLEQAGSLCNLENHVFIKFVLKQANKLSIHTIRQQRFLTNLKWKCWFLRSSLNVPNTGKMKLHGAREFNFYLFFSYLLNGFVFLCPHSQVDLFWAMPVLPWELSRWQDPNCCSVSYVEVKLEKWSGLCTQWPIRNSKWHS